MGENIADHGGLKIAEIAYENWLRRNNGQDTLLPALQVSIFKYPAQKYSRLRQPLQKFSSLF